MLVDPGAACVVGSRLVVKETTHRGEPVHTVAICRRVRQSAADDPARWRDTLAHYTLDTIESQAKAPSARGARAINLFHNISVIQYRHDRATGGGKACFFQIRNHSGDGITDAYKEEAAKSPELAAYLDKLKKNGPYPILPPTLQAIGEAGAASPPQDAKLTAALRGVLKKIYLNPAEFKGGDACVRCHDGQLWVRTPALKGLRFGSDFITKNLMPARPENLRVIGKHHAPWTAPENRPYFFKIDAERYLAKHHGEAYAKADQGARATLRRKVVECHRCHAIGKSRMSHRDEANGHGGEGHRQGLCAKFAANWFVPKAHETGKPPAGRVKFFPALDWGLNPDPEPLMRKQLTAAGAAPEDYFWMPPTAALSMQGSDDNANVKAYYDAHGLSLQAVRDCCSDPEMTHEGRKVCY